VTYAITVHGDGRHSKIIVDGTAILGTTNLLDSRSYLGLNLQRLTQKKQ